MAIGNEPQKPSGTGKNAEAGNSGSGKLEDRLTRLEAELVKKGALKQPVSEEGRSAMSSQVGQAMKLSSEFIAAIIVGALLGWFIDRVAGTSPWGLIILLLLGFCAGVLNVLRASGYVAEQGSIKTKAEREDIK